MKKLIALNVILLILLATLIGCSATSASSIGIIPNDHAIADRVDSSHLTTLEEAWSIVNERNPKAVEVLYIGEDAISYTNPPAPVESYIFEITFWNKKVISAVSKEQGIYFTYNNDLWSASGGGVSLFSRVSILQLSILLLVPLLIVSILIIKKNRAKS